MSRGSFHRILGKDLKFHACRLQVAQELINCNKEARLRCCWGFINLMENNLQLLHELLMSDEASFH
jgi:hypothetical protein